MKLYEYFFNAEDENGERFSGLYIDEKRESYADLLKSIFFYSIAVLNKDVKTGSISVTNTKAYN